MHLYSFYFIHFCFWFVLFLLQFKHGLNHGGIFSNNGETESWGGGAVNLMREGLSICFEIICIYHKFGQNFIDALLLNIIFWFCCTIVLFGKIEGLLTFCTFLFWAIAVVSAVFSVAWKRGPLFLKWSLGGDGGGT